jgi:hypothetical protein
MKRVYRDCFVALVFWAGVLSGAMAEECDAVDRATVSTPAPPGTSVELRRHLEQLKTQAAADVVVLGDSLARRWPQFGTIDSLGAPSIAVYGLESDRIQNLIWRMPGVASVQPDARNVVIWIGTNNLGEKACALEYGQQAAVELAHQLWPAASITLIGIIPRGEDYQYQNSARVAANQSAFGAQQVGRYRFVDASSGLICGPTNSRLLPDEIALSKCSFYQKDYIHLAKAGYAVVERLLRSLWYGK